MEMEGRGYSDIFRNSSEELFMKSLMDSTIGMPHPTMEMLGLRNLSQNFRTDSAELFQNWLTTGENHDHNSISIPHRTRQSSRRISMELSNLCYPHQHEGTLQQKRSNNDYSPENALVAEDFSIDPNHHPTRNSLERGVQASNLYLAKAWFHSSQPMTRSRSSELRRKYVAMQNAKTSIGIEAMNNETGQGINELEQELVNANVFNEAPMCHTQNQLGTFMFLSNSSSSRFNTQQMCNVDKVSSVVNMLKGTLEHKKHNNQTESTEAIEDSSNGLLLNDPEVLIESSLLNQEHENHFHEMPTIYQSVSPHVQYNNPTVLHVNEPIDFDSEDILPHTNNNQLRTLSEEPSQSASSAAAPLISSGLHACNGPSNSGQTLSRQSESGSKSRDFREHIYDNLKEDRKRGSLVRYGSVTLTGSVEKGDHTKKCRVERSRKMAEEAKERSSTPAIPSDMQSILKRCDNLEKEVRSLKLNLSFMNRKDSEQTQLIEELEKQNKELGSEKERLVEEIETILSKTGNIH